MQIVEECNPPFPYEIRFDWHTSKTDFVHIQTAGHVAGIAYYDKESFWSAHSTFGVWFSFRGVIVFDTPFIGKSPELPLPVLTAEEKEEIKKFTEQAQSEGWTNYSTLLKIRNVCQTGQDYRYTGSLLDYFYPISTTKQQIIERIRNKEINE